MAFSRDQIHVRSDFLHCAHCGLPSPARPALAGEAERAFVVAIESQCGSLVGFAMWTSRLELHLSAAMHKCRRVDVPRSTRPLEIYLCRRRLRSQGDDDSLNAPAQNHRAQALFHQRAISKHSTAPRDRALPLLTGAHYTEINRIMPRPRCLSKRQERAMAAIVAGMAHHVLMRVSAIYHAHRRRRHF